MQTPTREYISGLIAESPNYFDRKLKKEYKEWCEYIRTIFVGKVFNESVYQFLHGVDCNQCKTCGSVTKWVGITQGFSNYCNSKCSASNPETRKKRNATNVEKHGSLEAAEKAARENKKKTMLALYGVEHALQKSEFRDKLKSTLEHNFGEQGYGNPEITNKRKATNLAKFGVEHASMHEDVKAKRVSTNLERYGVETPLLGPNGYAQSIKTRRDKAASRIAAQAAAEQITPLFQEYTKVIEPHKWSCDVCGNVFSGDMTWAKVPRCPKCNPQNCSKGEGELREFVASLGVDYETNDRTIISPREIDILIPSKKLGIEYHGLYWHSEDKVGEDYHLEKLTAMQSKGYELIQVFESEWLGNQELVKARIRSKLGLNTRVFARKCKVVVPSKHEVNAFMDDNHIQGRCPSSSDYGLSLDGELLAVMTFGKSRYDKVVEWELLRFASKAGINVVGGASKLLSAFEKNNKPQSLISYCDRRWNTGASYLRMGFSLKRTSKPAYHYTQDGVILHNRVKFQKHKLRALLPEFDESKTEAQNMADNGFYKVWDCGTNVFIKGY